MLCFALLGFACLASFCGFVMIVLFIFCRFVYFIVSDFFDLFCFGLLWFGWFACFCFACFWFAFAFVLF